jgi:cytochrome c biogenesis protein CcdA
MIELLIAFGAGFISFLSPCVLPLIPGYISFISGQSLQELLGSKKIKDKKYLNDSLMTSIAGISAAMKNTG